MTAAVTVPVLGGDCVRGCVDPNREAFHHVCLVEVGRVAAVPASYRRGADADVSVEAMQVADDIGCRVRSIVVQVRKDQRDAGWVELTAADARTLAMTLLTAVERLREDTRDGAV